jgi:hypothetical protein
MAVEATWQRVRSPHSNVIDQIAPSTITMGLPREHVSTRASIL